MLLQKVVKQSFMSKRQVTYEPKISVKEILNVFQN